MIIEIAQYACPQLIEVLVAVDIAIQARHNAGTLIEGSGCIRRAPLVEHHRSTKLEFFGPARLALTGLRIVELDKAIDFFVRFRRRCGLG